MPNDPLVAWSADEIELARIICAEMYPHADPAKFGVSTTWGPLAASTLISLHAARVALRKASVEAERLGGVVQELNEQIESMAAGHALTLEELESACAQRDRAYQDWAADRQRWFAERNQAIVAALHEVSEHALTHRDRVRRRASDGHRVNAALEIEDVARWVRSRAAAVAGEPDRECKPAAVAATSDGRIESLDELHSRFSHPGYEYRVTTGPRKRWDEADTPPEGDGWERNITARYPEGWERFEYHEESYWRRPRPAEETSDGR